jgi:fatty acid desaturase
VPRSLDLNSLFRDLDALHHELRAGVSNSDFQHLRKIERWGRACSLLGFGSAWIIPNPVSALLISQGEFTRWTIMAHHVLHQGYDQVPGIPERYTSRTFARGWRRWVDWFDWMLPAAWDHEHNVMHHYRLGEKSDPDAVEFNLHWLQAARMPHALKVLIVFVVAAGWKLGYYAGNTVVEWKKKSAQQKNTEAPPSLGSWYSWWPFAPGGQVLWGQCLLPYAFWNVVALPLLFLPLGPAAAWAVFFNMLPAELIINLHSFAVIVTNHSGDDLYVFDERATGRGEFYFRQIVGSTKFRTGGDWNDCLHGWLNYQIEHHLWPRLTLLQYRKAQPRVKAICARYGVSYAQEPVWRRVIKAVNVMTGKTSMKRS